MVNPRKKAERGATQAFRKACARAGVVPEHVDLLWRLAETWPPNESGAGRRRTVLEDYGHWRLFEHSREGDRRAASSFERSWRKAARAFLGRGFTPEQVEEFTAAFFERVYSKASLFAWKQPFTVYLRTVLLNLARDEIRRLRRGRLRELSLDGPQGVGAEPAAAPDATPEQALLAEERRARVHRALARLAPIDRHILMECLVEGRSGQALAAVLGISRDALYQRLRRAKQRLRKELERGEGVSDP